MNIPLPDPDAIGFADVQFQLWLLRVSLTLGLPILLLATGLGQRVGAAFARIAGKRGVLAFAAVGGLYALLQAVMMLLVDFLQAQRFAPYTLVPPPTFMNWLPLQIGGIVEAVIAGVLLATVFTLLLRASPRFAWLWGASALGIAIIGYLAIFPLRSAMHSDAYQPLQDVQWQQRFASISARVGMQGVPVLVRQTTDRDRCRTSNSAIGLGPNRAIVLADQIFERWSDDMIEAAYAHELKHHLLDNGWKAAAMVLLLVFAGALVVQGAGMLGVRYFTGISSLSQPAAVLLLALGFQLYMQLIRPPVFNLLSQRIELEADRFSLELTQHSEARVQIAAEQCGRLWLPEETRFRQLYINNHPDMAARIRFAMGYRPWETGEPLVYRGLIR